MKKKIDAAIGQKFALAAGILMTRIFSTPLPTNARRLMFACGPACARIKNAMPDPNLKFDALGLGFVPGREWKGPSDIFVEEQRDGATRVWTNCRFWCDDLGGPFYLLTDDPDVCFSYDGHSLVPLVGTPDDRLGGIERARSRLKTAARLVPEDFDKQNIM